MVHNTLWTYTMVSEKKGGLQVEAMLQEKPSLANVSEPHSVRCPPPMLHTQLSTSRYRQADTHKGLSTDCVARTDWQRAIYCFRSRLSLSYTHMYRMEEVVLVDIHVLSLRASL